jgi:hypothetical protein
MFLTEIPKMIRVLPNTHLTDLSETENYDAALQFMSSRRAAKGS